MILLENIHSVPHDAAYRSLNGTVCPGCGRGKKSGFGFCRECHGLLSEAAREALRDRRHYRGALYAALVELGHAAMRVTAGNGGAW